jgi:hypothetical protein
MQHDTILTTVQHQNHTEINLLHIGASMKQKNLQGISIKNVMYANEQHILCIYTNVFRTALYYVARSSLLHSRNKNR